VKLFVVKQTRFNPSVQRMRAALDAGCFGKLVMGTVRVRRCRTQDYYDQAAWRGTWLLDGGVLANQASHHIDLLLWMFGDVQSVFGKAATRLVDIETEDTAAAVLQFTSGALGIIEATTCARPTDLESSISVLGERDTAVLGDIRGTADHQALLENVVGTLHGTARSLIDGHEARKTVELIAAIYDSIRTGREVVLGQRARPSLRLA
jgi:UDP-N-acetyl-2-amino-2-deoxyglucuronate dehydrogenase